MKLKTIIGMLAVAGCTLVGFAATDAELKAMLAKKDYMSAAVNVSKT